jgi:spermidine/putrescine transport system ATP-binding protein
VNSESLQGPAVSVQGVSKRFGAVDALRGISIDVAPGRFVSLLGPSGCGKTTLMRIIAGLDRQSEGRVVIDGKDLSQAPPHRRPVGLVFQRYALFPHMTVAENVAFALRLRRVDRKTSRDRVQDLLDLVQLGQFGGRSIDQLSGGQAQRVALARALAASPPVLLLDEPMSALDLKLRQAMQLELRRLQRKIGATFLFVTHDQDEAMVMSDEIVLMNNGAIIQRGTPEDVYRRPRTLFSARFLGEANLFQGSARRQGQEVLIDAGKILLRSDAPPPDAGMKKAWTCIRPEAITIAAAPHKASSEQQPNKATGRVREAIFQGAFRRYAVQLEGYDLSVQQPAAANGTATFSEGDLVELAWPASAVIPIEDDTDA